MEEKKEITAEDLKTEDTSAEIICKENKKTGKIECKAKKKKVSAFQAYTKKTKEFLLDHPILKCTLAIIGTLFVLTISSFLYAYGFKAFIAPDVAGVPHLISGGAAGVAQVLIIICELCGLEADPSTLESIFFFLVNFPLFFVAFKFVGKRFAFLTLYEITLASLFLKFLPQDVVGIFKINDDPTARALFAGVLTGISSGFAYVVGGSTGGTDIVAMSIAERKSTGVGKYAAMVNITIIITYVILNSIKLGNMDETKMAFYTIIYSIVASYVADLINVKNRKVQIEINTNSVDLAPMLLRNFPHGCTIVDAVGGYTGKPRKIIYMIVSMTEVKAVVDFARRIDETCFVNTTISSQVYGRFYIKPIK